MKSLVFDPFAGISGDMTLAALLDLGLEQAWLRDFVAALGIGAIEVTIETVKRRGIAAPQVRFAYPPERAHRHLHHVVEIIERTNTPDAVKRLAVAAFTRVAEAEARVHGTMVQKVHFHEVGATDAILDIVCVMAGVTELGFERFFTRPVAVGSGWVDIEHGRYPVPAPATLGILAGIPLTGMELAGECTTPTGAAILATLTGGQTPPEPFTPGRTGFGAGSRDPQDRPNVLRVFEATHGDTARESVWILQADMDDLSPEYAAAAQAALIDGGALDAVLFPVSMKKGRQGVRLEILASGDRLAELERILFLSTSTIGVRRWPVDRTMLAREITARDWRGQPIRWKQVTLPDGTVREKPEYEDVVRAGAALGLTPYQVRRELEQGQTKRP